MTVRADSAGLIRRARGCSDPIRLRGRHQRIDAETGELLADVITMRCPGGVLLVPCGDRRSARCPACAETYRGDAYQLVASGLRGGKGVPQSVARNPTLMLTLTAPSFGRVHTIRTRDGGCPCGERHARDDEVLGTALYPNSYRYNEQATWNHLASTLWKRTAQGIRRKLARELGVRRNCLSQVVRVRFIKAAEFQRRGVVHYHVVIRLDGPAEAGSAPPAACTSALLRRAVGSVIRDVEVRTPAIGGSGQAIRWGRQTEVAPLSTGQASRAAGYIAKYATKATESVAGGVVIPRLRSVRELEGVAVPEHALRLIEAAWRVGGVRGLEGARRWAHQFGYGGHVLTKSPGYSATFGDLRAARLAWKSGRPLTLRTITRGRLDYAGRGYRDPVVAQVAAMTWAEGLATRPPRRQSGAADAGPR